MGQADTSEGEIAVPIDSGRTLRSGRFITTAPKRRRQRTRIVSISVSTKEPITSSPSISSSATPNGNLIQNRIGAYHQRNTPQFLCPLTFLLFLLLSAVYLLLFFPLFHQSLSTLRHALSPQLNNLTLAAIRLFSPLPSALATAHYQTAHLHSLASLLVAPYPITFLHNITTSTLLPSSACITPDIASRASILAAALSHAAAASLSVEHVLRNVLPPTALAPYARALADISRDAAYCELRHRWWRLRSCPPPRRPDVRVTLETMRTVRELATDAAGARDAAARLQTAYRDALRVI